MVAADAAAADQNEFFMFFLLCDRFALCLKHVFHGARGHLVEQLRILLHRRELGRHPAVISGLAQAGHDARPVDAAF